MSAGTQFVFTSEINWEQVVRDGFISATVAGLFYGAANFRVERGINNLGGKYTSLYDKSTGSGLAYSKTAGNAHIGIRYGNRSLYFTNAKGTLVPMRSPNYQQTASGNVLLTPNLGTQNNMMPPLLSSSTPPHVLLSLPNGLAPSTPPNGLVPSLIKPPEVISALPPKGTVPTDAMVRRETMYDTNGKYTGGRTKSELDSLEYDPAKKAITSGSQNEAEIGLDLERKGVIGHLERSADPKAEFIDSHTGKKYDVKSFQSTPVGVDGMPITSPRKGAFKVENAMKNIIKEFDKNGNDFVIIDKSKLTQEHINELINAINEAGIENNIIWWPE